MLYPRETCDGKLVEDSQMVSYKEHMAQRHRALFLKGVINTDTAESRHLLLAMDTISNEPIKMFITSPGGDIDATFLIYDTMRLIKSPIITIGEYCASGAAMLLAAGDKRYLFPHCKVMLHLPSGQMGGDSRDWEIQHKQMQQYKDTMVDIFLECGATRNHEEILKDMDRDFWLKPEGIIDYGLADEVISPETWGNLIGGGLNE